MEPANPYPRSGARLFARRGPKAITLLSVLFSLLVLALLSACGPHTPPPPGPGDGDDDDGNGEPPLVGDVRLVETAAGFEVPVAIANAGDARLFVVERAGRILIVEDGAVLPEPFLDMRDDVKSDAGEQGMIGLAFPPDYAATGTFYVYFTNTEGRGVLARFQRDAADPNRAAPGSEILVELGEASEYHNGGQLAFGPDGYLYWAVGDSGTDILAQDLDSRRGKILRLDVSPATGYAVPADNPFAGASEPRNEIWAYGLRNPWRFSFDAVGGFIYIADVGENEQEEVNVQPISADGLNYGWPHMEGTLCYATPDCDPSLYTAPTFTYDHDEDRGRSITGGYVYRGPVAPDLEGVYVYGDWMTSRLYTASASEDWRIRRLFEDQTLQTATFGTGADGRLYVADFADGTIYEITQEMPQ